MDPSAFDAFAPTYDADFTHTWLGQLLRQRVWRVLAQQFTAGRHLLELACGTGEDAVWLAQQGILVTATDGSAEMVRATAVKAEQAGVSERVTAVPLSLQDLVAGRNPYSVTRHPIMDYRLRITDYGLPITDYDGVVSNFGGLNTIGEWRPLAESLAGLVKSGGKLVLVVMGPWCPWEVGWHLLHGEWGTAVRRFRSSAPAAIGKNTIPIWYPSARRLRQEFAPWFDHVHTESLGLWLPPSYLGHLVERWPRLFTRLNRWERRTARLTGGWGDHYVLVLERIEGV
ncbi:MAG TPA: class I SAM-dependent methyltransferase [Chloroflexota bacterium]|nr:class I SAM-dependent methyltransferase [Chloroflexota bacterium]